MDTYLFQQFCNDCIGKWTTERTYHYLTHQQVERSSTEFSVNDLDINSKAKVLRENSYYDVDDLDRLPGFSLGFYTISETGEEVSQYLSLIFIPKRKIKTVLEGDYLRDRAYEEAKPMVSRFHFFPARKELLMTTYYTRIVSVDSITLVSPNVRIRKIINYQRPPSGEPLQNVVLAGFGVEQKAKPKGLQSINWNEMQFIS